MASTPEGKVKAMISKFLKERGVWRFMPVNNGMGVVGIPDFICCWDGLFVAIEAKAPDKHSNTTPNQKLRIKEINDSGGIAVVVSCAEHLIALEELVNAKKQPN